MDGTTQTGIGNGGKRMCFGPECEKPVEWARTAQQAVGLDSDCICEEQKIPVRDK